MDYLSVEQFKAYHPEVDTAKFTDTTISGMISRASKLVDSYVYGLKGVTSETEVITGEMVEGHIDGAGDLVIFPRKYPVKSVEVATVVIGNFEQSLTLTSGSKNYYNIPKNGWYITIPGYVPIEATGFSTVNFQELRSRSFFVRLDYTAGYAAADIPEDFVEACELIVKSRLSGQHNAMGVEEFSQGNLRIRYGKSNQDLKSAYDILAGYRRMI